MLNSNSSLKEIKAKSAYGRVNSTRALSCLDWLAAYTLDAIDIDSLI